MRKRRLGKIQVTIELLEEFLKIPSDCKIVHIRTFPFEEFNDGCVEITLEGERIPIVSEGARIPHIHLIYEKTVNGEIKSSLKI